MTPELKALRDALDRALRVVVLEMQRQHPDIERSEIWRQVVMRAFNQLPGAANGREFLHNALRRERYERTTYQNLIDQGASNDVDLQKR
jgi:hypothetical protein